MSLKIKLVIIGFIIIILTPFGLDKYYPWYQFRSQEGLLHATRGDSEAINDIKFSPDGRWLFTAGHDGLRRWDAKTFRLISKDPITTIPGKAYDINYIYTIAVSKSQPVVYVGGVERDVVIWNYESREKVGSIPTRDRFAKSIDRLALSPDGSILAITENGGTEFRKHRKEPLETDFSILLWDVRNSTIRERLFGHAEEISQLHFSADGKRLLSRGKRSDVVWDVENGKKVSVYESVKRDGLKVRYPDGKLDLQLRRVTGFKYPVQDRISTREGKLYIHDPASGRVVRESVQFDNGMQVKAVAISPDGTIFASGGNGLAMRGGFGASIDQGNRNLCIWKLDN